MHKKNRPTGAWVEGLESRVLRHGGTAGNGLLGQYFNNRDFTDPKFARTDATINFSWSSGSPSSSIAPDTFSVRWTGQLVAHKSESYTFYTSTDDGVRLWIDGQLVIDKFVDQRNTEHASKPVALTAGQAVDVRLDYYENTGNAVAKLLWSSATTPKAIIPSDHLFPEAAPPPSPPPPPPPPPPTSSPTGAIRIDAAGSSNYTDADGKVWLKDAYYSGGMLSLGGFDIAGTSDDVMYWTRRFGKSFSYGIPVASGDYRVTLHFADASYDVGGRLFNVTAEGKTILSRFDIVAAAGGVKGVAVTRSFDLPVTDGKLNLAFSGVLNNATLSAIEVSPLAVSPRIAWQTVAPSPAARAEATGAVVNDKLYVFGGYVFQNGAVVAQYRCDVYDPASNTWTRLGDMPENFTHAGIAVDGSSVWLVGQYSGDHPGPGSTHVWKYDTLTDTWTRGPDLPQARGAGAAAIVGRSLHFFGGMDETRTIECGEHWSLDLDNVDAGWTARAAMPNPRNHIAAAAVNGKIYAIGGQHGQEEAQVAQSQVDCYDPQTDTWTSVAPLPQARSHIVASTFVMDGKIIVLGGEIGFNLNQSSVFAYDPLKNAWSLLGTLPAPRSTSVAGAIAPNTIITTTGNDPNATSATWIGTIT